MNRIIMNVESEANIPVGGDTAAAPPPAAAPAPALESVMDRARASDVAAATEMTTETTPGTTTALPSQEATATPTETAQPTTPAASTVEAAEALSAPESALAPVFDLGTPTSETFQQAMTIVQNFQYDDPVAAENMLHGFYYANEAKVQNFALQRLGIPKEKVGEFVTWARSGAALPQPQAPAPFPEVVRDAAGNLVADVAGQQLITLPSGRVVDVLDDTGAELYDQAKFRYGAELAEQQRQAEARVAEQQQREQQQRDFQAFQQDCLYGVQSAYLDDMQALVIELVTPAIANLSADDKPFGEDFEASIIKNVVGSKEVAEIGRKARAHLEAIVQDTINRGQLARLAPEQIKQACIERLREGRMVNFAQQQKAIIRREINARKDAFLKRMLRLNKAELAATSTAPRTDQVQPIETVAPPPRGQGPRSINAILSEAGEHDRRAAQAR